MSLQQGCRFFLVSGWCFLNLQQQGCSFFLSLGCVSWVCSNKDAVFFGSPGGVTLVTAIRMQFFVSGWCFSSSSNKNRVSFSRQEEQNKSRKTPKKGFKIWNPPAFRILRDPKKKNSVCSLSLPLIMLLAKTPTKTGDSFKSQRNWNTELCSSGCHHLIHLELQL